MSVMVNVIRELSFCVERGIEFREPTFASWGGGTWSIARGGSRHTADNQ